MILEGYNVQDCHCNGGDSLSFQEVKYFESTRFLIICNVCGNASNGSPTKEGAVHIWNKSAKQLLFG